MICQQLFSSLWELSGISVDILGRDNLLNERDATPKPPTDQWSAEKRAKLGVRALVRAYEAFRRFVTQPHFEPDYHDYIADYVDRKLYLRGKRAGQRKRRAGGVVPVEEVHLTSSDEDDNSKEEDEIIYVLPAKSNNISSATRA